MYQQQETSIINFEEQSGNQGNQQNAQTGWCAQFLEKIYFYFSICLNPIMKIFKSEKKQQKDNNDNIGQKEEEVEKLIIIDHPTPILQITQSEIEETQKFVYNLYNKTTNIREVDQQFRAFVRDQLDFNELKKNYSLSPKAGKELRTKYCDSFRPVRGDGNCFYTAFGFQFFQHLLFNYSQEDFNKFINQCLEIQLSMKLYIDQQQEITNQNLEKALLNNFLNKLQKLRLIQDERERFERYVQQEAAYQKQNDDIDSCFYALQTIFLRNLCNYIIETHIMKEALFDRINLLIWEIECNSNEIIIDALSKFLKLHIILILFEDKDFMVNEYGDKGNYKIILLIKPGHYNIGIQQEKQLNNEFK